MPGNNNNKKAAPRPAWQLFLAAAVRTAAIYGNEGALQAMNSTRTCTLGTAFLTPRATTAAAKEEGVEEGSELAEKEKIQDSSTCSSGDDNDNSDISCEIKNERADYEGGNSLSQKDGNVADSIADVSVASHSQQKLEPIFSSGLPSLQLRPGEHFGASEFELLFNWLVGGGVTDEEKVKSTTTNSFSPLLSQAAVRQLDWCNSIDWEGAGAGLALAWSEDNSDIRRSLNNNDDDGERNGDGRDLNGESPGKSDDAKDNSRNFSHTSTISDVRFNAFDFVALHHHGRGNEDGSGSGSGGCVAQYCGCCGA